MAKRMLAALSGSLLFLLLLAPGALACGGLVAPNGTISLLRTTTMAGYRNGIEHYVTSFEFAGGSQEVGSIVPLPGEPTRVIRGGDWTLQRLEQEVAPPIRAAEDHSLALEAAPAPAAVILKTKIDALDIVVLKGGGDAVGAWAHEHGFVLPPDAPEILDFYAARSPYFMAARFDGQTASELGQQSGDATPVHLVIPTDRPWIPLRILTLGQSASSLVQADVFLLTEDKPNLLPAPIQAASAPGGAAPGMVLERNEAASDLLVSDLRSDAHMKWVDGSGMWLSFLKIDARASALQHDLAIDPTGTAVPSSVDAGLQAPDGPTPSTARTLGSVVALGAIALIVAAFAIMVLRRSGRERFAA